MADGNSLPLYFTGREWLCVNFGIKVRYGKAWRSLHRPGERSLVRMIFWESWFLQVGDTAFFFNTNHITFRSCRKWYLKLILMGTARWPKFVLFFYQICAFVTRFLGDLRGVPCHDDCWIVCFLFRSSCCLKYNFPSFLSVMGSTCCHIESREVWLGLALSGQNKIIKYISVHQIRPIIGPNTVANRPTKPLEWECEG